ncbi:MAG: sulfatase, partial [Deferribacteres bacterium]|nr:sulfatase [Deferribacteres bacterium]
MKKEEVSYPQIFRLVFVLFSLYLLRDAFFRWDGFSFYASFSEFLPSVALVTILWTLVAALTAFSVWLPGRVLQWLCLRKGWKLGTGHVILFMLVFLLLQIAALKLKQNLFPHYRTSVEIKLLILSGIASTAVFLTWLLRGKASKWMGFITAGITPLVWLFGIFVILSVPLVAYYTWGGPAGGTASPEISGFRSADVNRPNIILVTFDTLSARDMSAYGYDRQTTPFIDSWSRSASLFSRAEAESNFTTPATASLVTGKRVWTHRTYHLAGSRPAGSDTESMPMLLKKNGYYNMAFIVNPFTSVNVLGISNSFDAAPNAAEFALFGKYPVTGSDVYFGIIDGPVYRLFGDRIRMTDWLVKSTFIFGKLAGGISRDLSRITGTNVPPEKAFNSFLKVLDGNPPRPFFAWIHLLPPHFPYLAPSPYKGMFDSSPEFATFKSLVQFKTSNNLFYPPEIQPAIDIMRARYDEFIRYSDEQFREFIAGLEKRGVLDNTVIILSSDHGESFENNFFTHGGPHLYEQLTHIPLIIKEPGQREGRVINDLVEQIDIPATILDLAGIPVPRWMEGRSLVPLMRGEKIPPRPAFSMNLETNRSRGAHPITSGTIAVWEGDYKLIYYLNKKKALLFNLREDRGELDNLFDREPETGRRLLALITQNLARANEKIT